MPRAILGVILGVRSCSLTHDPAARKQIDLPCIRAFYFIYFTYVRALSARHFHTQTWEEVEIAMARKPTVEEVGGERYEYFPIGKFVVEAKGVCGGRATFKYSRIEIAGVVARLHAGEDIDAIVEDYHGRISREAILEAAEILGPTGKMPKRTAA